VHFERALPTSAQPADRIERFFQASLLGLLASGFLALAFSGYLDSATIGLTTLGLLARAVTVFGNFRERRFSTPIANALTLAYIGFYPVDYIYLSREFIPATVHLVCFLSVIRILSARTNRDYFFVKVLAFLELLGATLMSSNILLLGDSPFQPAAAAHRDASRQLPPSSCRDYCQYHVRHRPDDRGPVCAAAAHRTSGYPIVRSWKIPHHRIRQRSLPRATRANPAEQRADAACVNRRGS
jgi:hypothetical protein